MFVDDLTEILTSILRDCSNTIISDDFNIHTQDPNDVDAMAFNDTMKALGLNQHVQASIHNKGNILDLIFTENGSNLTLLNCHYGEFISDHVQCLDH